MKFTGKNAKFLGKKAIKMPSNLFWNCEGNIFLLIITEKTMPINRVSVFPLLHHLVTQIWWVLNFKGIKVDPATL